MSRSSACSTRSTGAKVDLRLFADAKVEHDRRCRRCRGFALDEPVQGMYAAAVAVFAYRRMLLTAIPCWCHASTSSRNGSTVDWFCGFLIASVFAPLLDALQCVAISASSGIKLSASSQFC